MVVQVVVEVGSERVCCVEWVVVDVDVVVDEDDEGAGPNNLLNSTDVAKAVYPPVSPLTPSAPPVPALAPTDPDPDPDPTPREPKSKGRTSSFNRGSRKTLSSGGVGHFREVRGRRGVASGLRFWVCGLRGNGRLGRWSAGRGGRSVGFAVGARFDVEPDVVVDAGVDTADRPAGVSEVDDTVVCALSIVLCVRRRRVEIISDQPTAGRR